MLLDTHCHIHFRAYDKNRDEVLARIKEKNVGMITVGTNYPTSASAVEFVKNHKNVWAAVGTHPHHLFPGFTDPDEEENHSVEIFDYEKYKALAVQEKVVAIGECGIDIFRLPDGCSREEVLAKQEAVFRMHLDLADELDLPVIVHGRDAHEEIRKILEEYVSAGKLKKRGVIHCYTGTISEAAAYLPLGFYIGFTGIITFPPRKNQTETLAQVVASLPLDKILIETDAPYLSPVPHRGKQCEPQYVEFVARKIAEIKGVAYEEVVEQSYQNAKNLFNLP